MLNTGFNKIVRQMVSNMADIEAQKKSKIENELFRRSGH